MNKVFVLMGQLEEHDVFCVGVFSTKENAEATIPQAEATFPGEEFWVEEHILDDFNWELVYDK